MSQKGGQCDSWQRGPDCKPVPFVVGVWGKAPDWQRRGYHPADATALPASAKLHFTAPGLASISIPPEGAAEGDARPGTRATRRDTTARCGHCAALHAAPAVLPALRPRTGCGRPPKSTQTTQGKVQGSRKARGGTGRARGHSGPKISLNFRLAQQGRCAKRFKFSEMSGPGAPALRPCLRPTRQVTPGALRHKARGFRHWGHLVGSRSAHRWRTSHLPTRRPRAFAPGPAPQHCPARAVRLLVSRLVTGVKGASHGFAASPLTPVPMRESCRHPVRGPPPRGGSPRTGTPRKENEYENLHHRRAQSSPNHPPPS